MGYSKRQFVQSAFEELGLSSTDLEPEDNQMALRRLDAMMADWDARNIHLGYPRPNSIESSSLDTETNVPAYATEAVYTNLAVRLAPSFGKQVSRETKTIAKNGYDTLTAKSAKPPERQFPSTLPLGAGNKPWRGGNEQFMPEPVDRTDDPYSELFLDK